MLLCVGVDPSSVRYDVAGLDWWGRPERGALSKVTGGLVNAVAFAVDAATRDGGPEDGSADTPKVVLWEPQLDTIATRACRVTSARSWLVLTPYRLGCVAVPERQPEPEPDKSLFDRVTGIAKSARDRGRFGGGRPVMTSP